MGATGGGDTAAVDAGLAELVEFFIISPALAGRLRARPEVVFLPELERSPGPVQLFCSTTATQDT